MAARSTTPEEVLTHLERILASREFASAPRLSSFLRFVVETALDGKAGEIKESLIAVEVYGRPADYNPQIDSTVRVEAGRLRTRLQKWYESDGQNDVVRIELPKGRYVPVFQHVREPRRLHVPAAAVVLGFFAAVFSWSRTDARTPDAETMEIYHRAMICFESRYSRMDRLNDSRHGARSRSTLPCGGEAESGLCERMGRTG